MAEKKKKSERREGGGAHNLVTKSASSVRAGLTANRLTAKVFICKLDSFVVEPFKCRRCPLLQAAPERDS